VVHEDTSLMGVTSGSRIRESHGSHKWFTKTRVSRESQVVHEDASLTEVTSRESQVVHEDASLMGVTSGSRRRESHGSHKWFTKTRVSRESQVVHEDANLVTLITLMTDLLPAPLKLQPYGTIQIRLLLLLLLLLLWESGSHKWFTKSHKWFTKTRISRESQVVHEDANLTGVTSGSAVLII